MRIVLLSILVIGFSTSALAAPKGNAVRGKEKSAVCAACHGPDGNRPLDDTHPRLAGQHQDYLLQALKDYKNGSRKNAVMVGQVATLSEQDMADLATYFSGQKGQIKDLSAAK